MNSTLISISAFCMLCCTCCRSLRCCFTASSNFSLFTRHCWLSSDSWMNGNSHNKPVIMTNLKIYQWRRTQKSKYKFYCLNTKQLLVIYLAFMLILLQTYEPVAFWVSNNFYTNIFNTVDPGHRAPSSSLLIWNLNCLKIHQRTKIRSIVLKK